MPVTAVDKDHDAGTLTITSEFDAPVDRVWELWANPRLLEKWWAPPGFPTTFAEHELKAGARSVYYMGDVRAEWQIVSVDPPHGFEALDGEYADTGKVDPEMPQTKMVVQINPTASGSRMSVVTHFLTGDAMDAAAVAGMEEGMGYIVEQFEALLAELTEVSPT